jgi:peptidoglycan-N-acetylglucosamine deacetylase
MNLNDKLLRAGLAWSLRGLLGAVTRVHTAEPAVALTFDDGPDQATPELLRLLERHGARATFFVLGASIAQHREVLTQAARGGHELGNHSWDHPCFLDIGAEERERQIARTQAELARIAREAGVTEPRLFRPPFGAQSLPIALQMRRLGLTTVNWSMNSQDWHLRHSRHMRARLEQGLTPGDIVLFHDGLFVAPSKQSTPQALPPHPDRTAMLETLAWLLDEYAGRLAFVTVSELLEKGTAVRRP